MKLNAISLVLLASCLSASAQNFPSSSSPSYPGGPPYPQLCFNPIPCTPTPSGLVAWYPFDGANGQEEDVATGSKHSTGLDKSVVGKSSGILGTFLDLSAGAGYVEVAGALAFEPTNGGYPLSTKEIDFFGNEFSISAWFKTSNKVTISPILDRREGSLQNLRGYTLFLYNGRPGFQLAGAGQVPAPAPPYSNWILPATSANPDLRDGIWHHIVVSVDRTSPNGGQFYVDNHPAFPAFDPSPFSDRNLQTSAPLLIGRHMDGIPWKGGIDEVMIFQKALNLEEVGRLAHAPTNPLCPCS